MLLLQLLFSGNKLISLLYASEFYYFRFLEQTLVYNNNISIIYNMATIRNFIIIFTCYLVRATLSRQEGRRGISDGRVRKTTPLGSEPVIAVCQCYTQGQGYRGFFRKIITDREE